MHLALNMAKITKGGFSRNAIEETEQIIQTPCTEVQEEEKGGVEFPGHSKIMASQESHPALIRENHADPCHASHNGTTMNRQKHWRCKGPGELPPQPTPHPPRTRPSPPGGCEESDSTEIECAPSG
jgi:hypothetical protein